MSITTSSRLNSDQLVARLPSGSGFTSRGADLETAAQKTITGIGVDDATLQTAVTAAAAAFVDRDANSSTLRSRAAQALTANATFLALASPTQAQTLAEVKALARQNNGIIRLMLGQFDDVSDT